MHYYITNFKEIVQNRSFENLKRETVKSGIINWKENHREDVLKRDEKLQGYFIYRGLYIATKA